MDATLAYIFSKLRLTEHSLVMVILVMAVLVLELGTYAEAGTYNNYYMEDYCKAGSIDTTITLSPSGMGSAVTVKASREEKIPDDFPDTCRIRIRAPKKYLVVVSIRRVRLKRDGDKKCSDYLLIHRGPGQNKRYCNIVENKEQKKSLASIGQNFINLTLHAEDSEGKKGFEIIVTAAFIAKECPEDFFKCSNGRCIAEDLVCDKRNNCGDLSDETGTTSGCAHSFKPAIIIMLLIVAILIVGVIFLVAIYMKRRRMIPTNYNRSASNAYQLAESSPYAPTTTPVGKDNSA